MSAAPRITKTSIKHHRNTKGISTLKKQQLGRYSIFWIGSKGYFRR